MGIITLERAIEIISKEINGAVIFNQEHDEALRMALDLLIKVRTGQVIVQFTKQ